MTLSTWSGPQVGQEETLRKPKVCQIPEDQVGKGAVMNHAVVVGVEVTGSQEAVDGTVHIIASGKLIGNKVAGFPQIEVCAAIIVISRGEDALERSLLVRVEGGPDLAIRGGRIRPRVSTSENDSGHVVVSEEGVKLLKGGRENWSCSGSSENKKGNNGCAHCSEKIGEGVIVKS